MTIISSKKKKKSKNDKLPIRVPKPELYVCGECDDLKNALKIQTESLDAAMTEIQVLQKQLETTGQECASAQIILKQMQDNFDSSLAEERRKHLEELKQYQQMLNRLNQKQVELKERKDLAESIAANEHQIDTALREIKKKKQDDKFSRISKGLSVKPSVKKKKRVPRKKKKTSV